MSLATAHAALARSDRRGALDALLEVWRAHRAPAIADAIDLLSEDLTRALPAIEGASRAKLQASWLEVASADDAADLGRLLAVLDAEPCTLMRDRIDRLAVRPHDPRLSRALAAFMSRTPCPCTSTPNAPMWTQIWKLVSALGDVRVRPALERHARNRKAGGFFEVIAARATKALATLAEPAPLSRDDAKQLAQIVTKAKQLATQPPSAAPVPKPAPRTAATEQSLLQQIYDAPDDDAPRLVYADLLTARGDPRGELIALQCRAATAPLTPAQRKREQALLREHGRRWLGPLEPAIGKHGLVYERGFVAGCELAFKSKPQRDRLLRHPAWATVRRLIAPEPALLLPRVEAGATTPSPMRGLRTLDGIRPAVLHELATAGLPAIGEVRFVIEDGEQLALDEVRAAFPRLHHARVRLPEHARPAACSWLFDSGWPRSLARLDVELLAHGDHLPVLADWLPRVPAHVTTFVVDLLVDWRATATRAGKRWTVIAEPLASFAEAATCKAMTKGLAGVTVLPIPED